jgi:hypothetical protein
MATVTPKTVVILGEEFAGIRLAKELSRLTTNDRTLDIDLVNQENCFAFQPMLPVKIPLSHQFEFPNRINGSLSRYFMKHALSRVPFLKIFKGKGEI